MSGAANQKRLSVCAIDNIEKSSIATDNISFLESMGQHGLALVC
jgi:hypothetical protein